MINVTTFKDDWFEKMIIQTLDSNREADANHKLLATSILVGFAMVAESIDAHSESIDAHSDGLSSTLNDISEKFNV